MRFSTKAIRIGQTPEGEHKAVIQPLYQSATFAWESLDQFPRHDYTRVANPNRTTLEQVLAELENARHCVCFGSGMAAVMAALSLLECGDHVLVASDIYGGTFRVCEGILPRQGIVASSFDASRPETIAAEAKPNTKLLIFESPTNPTLQIVDVEGVVREAKKAGIRTVADNTFATPYLQNPLDLGVDIVVHSTTKYISGHSDVIGGAILTNDTELHAAFFEYIKTVGSVPSPFDCWLTLRGVKTLALRMKQHCANARAVAEALDAHPRVTKVYFPGLPHHPNHSLAAGQMRDFGGMVAFEVDGTPEQTKRVAESTKVFQLAESLGGVESLIGYPTVMSHACMTEEQRLEMGVKPTLIRLSVGIEDPEDLIEDLTGALDGVLQGSRSAEQELALR